MSFWRMTLREIQHRAVRTCLTVLSVALGTAAVISVALTSSTVRMAQASMFAALVGKTDFLITAEGGASFDAELLQAIAQVSGVRAAVPTAQRSTLLYVGDKRAKTQILGIDTEVDRLVRDYEVVSGEMPAGGSTLALDERFAKSMGLELGAEVKLLTRSGLQAWKVGALLRHQGASSLSQGEYFMVPCERCRTSFVYGRNWTALKFWSLKMRIEIVFAKNSQRHCRRVGVKAPCARQSNGRPDDTFRRAWPDACNGVRADDRCLHHLQHLSNGGWGAA